jgi:hypothetical protein
LPSALRKFIADYHAGLDGDVQDNPRFAFRLRVTLELAARGADVPAIQFTHLDDMSDEERAAVEAMGRKGQVVIREQQRSVQHLDWLAWRALRVRPPSGDQKPERTDERYCIYDRAHRDYVYSPADVKRLIKELSSEVGYKAMLGIEAVAKSAATGTGGKA